MIFSLLCNYFFLDVDVYLLFCSSFLFIFFFIFITFFGVNQSFCTAFIFCTISKPKCNKLIIMAIIIVIVIIIVLVIKPHIRVLERVFTLNLREREQTRCSEQAKFLKLEMTGTGLEPQTFYFVNEHSSIYLVHR